MDGCHNIDDLFLCGLSVSDDDDDDDDDEVERLCRERRWKEED